MKLNATYMFLISLLWILLYISKTFSGIIIIGIWSFMPY